MCGVYTARHLVIQGGLLIIMQSIHTRASGQGIMKRWGEEEKKNEGGYLIKRAILFSPSSLYNWQLIFFLFPLRIVCVAYIYDDDDESYERVCR